jgi:hypothetical protein
MEPIQRKQSGLEERLAKHPGLRTQVERMLEEVENASGALHSADEAEDAIVERVRQMGREALQSWMLEREKAVQPPREKGLRRGGKKNCGG